MSATSARHEHAADARRVGMIFDAALNGGGLVVCGWCGEWLGTKRGLAAGAVSHGICAACAEAFDQELGRVGPAAKLEEVAS